MKEGQLLAYIGNNGFVGILISMWVLTGGSSRLWSVLTLREVAEKCNWIMGISDTEYMRRMKKE